MIRLKGLLNEQPEVKESEYVDDDEIIKYKDKDGKPAEMKASAAKSQKQGSPAKVAWDQANIKGYEEWDKEYKASQIQHRMGLRQRSDYGEKGGVNPFQKDDPNAPNYDKNFTFEPDGADKPKGMDVSTAKKEPEAGKVSFDRKADKDADSKVKDGKLTIGDDSRKEEVDIKAFVNTLDLPGIDEKTLEDKFNSGDASITADDSGRISFYFSDDKLGELTAEIEDDGTFYFDGDSLNIGADDQEYLKDTLRGDLDYYHDQFREQDEGQIKLKSLLKK